MKAMPTEGCSENLGLSVVKGASWIAVLRISARILRAVRLAVLARLLSPKDFGTFAVALLTVDFLTTFFHSGFIQALIHKKTDTELYLDTAWTVGIIRRGFLALFLFVLAPQAALFFNTPEAAPVIRLLSASFLFRAAANIAVVFFEKDLAYHKYFRYEFIGAAVDFTVSISTAFLLRSYWALAWGFLAGIAAQSAISYLMSPYRPRLRLDFSRANELFRYGKWIVLSGILLYFGANLGHIFVGRLLGTALLGLFLVASRTADLATGEISRVATRVVFPAVAKIQDDAARLQSAWFRVLGTVWTIALLPATILLCLTPEITSLFLGHQWIEAVPAIRLLTAAGAVMAAAQAASPLFRGTGSPRNDVLMHSARVLVLLFVLYPLSRRWGIAGAAFGAGLGAAAAAGIALLLSQRTLRVSARRYFEAICPPAAGALVMAGVILLIRNAFKTEPALTFPAAAMTAAAAAAGTAAYGLILVLISRIRPEWSILKFPLPGFRRRAP
jgi:lipopolysaccharide exporter